jgi:outer membrane protein assembly factor BamA
LRALLFFDAGQAYLEGEDMGLGDLHTSTGARGALRHARPEVPFRTSYARNPEPDPFPPKTTFGFAVGTTS